MTEPDDTDGDTATHADRLSLVIDDARARQAEISGLLRTAFAAYIETRPTDWIVFEQVSVPKLSAIFLKYPHVVKPITAICNIAGRAIRRDLEFEVNTYKPRLTQSQADQLAGYVRPFLPTSIAIPAVEAVDDWFFIDKELRKTRGHWERLITAELERRSGLGFRKRLFDYPVDDGSIQKFELDAACPPTGEPIQIGVDVKGISHPRDIHKRIDEIVNKAEKFKAVYPGGRFGSVVHYPFQEGRESLKARMRNKSIDGLVFALDSKQSVESAVLELLIQMGVDVADATLSANLYDHIAGESAP